MVVPSPSILGMGLRVNHQGDIECTTTVVKSTTGYVVSGQFQNRIVLTNSFGYWMLISDVLKIGNCFVLLAGCVEMLFTRMPSSR